MLKPQASLGPCPNSCRHRLFQTRNLPGMNAHATACLSAQAKPTNRPPFPTSTTSSHSLNAIFALKTVLSALSFPVRRTHVRTPFAAGKRTAACSAAAATAPDATGSYSPRRTGHGKTAAPKQKNKRTATKPAVRTAPATTGL